MTSERIRPLLVERGRALGFDDIRITRADAALHLPERLDAWLAQGRHGAMEWMAVDPGRRAAPVRLWGEVRSLILCGINCPPLDDPLAAVADRRRGVISAYAQRRDYHDVIKGRLKELAGFLVARTGCDVKVFVDTAPVMEKPLAAAAGLGWQGKHTVLASRRFGSWLMLGAIFTTLEFEPDASEKDRCGSCRRCLDICPTQAFPAPYQLDARRCISYLTIEHKGHIPPEFRAAIGNRVFGCDDCLAVCPWNKFAQAGREARLAIRQELVNPPLADMIGLDDAAFRTLFAATPVKRTGRDRFIRNVLIAVGNSGDCSLLPQVIRLLDDPSPLVRAMAVWALSRLSAAEAGRRVRTHVAQEPDEAVRTEWATVQAECRPASAP